MTGEAQAATEEKLSDFLTIVKRGPPLARVTELEAREIEAREDEREFVQYR